MLPLDSMSELWIPLQSPHVEDLYPQRGKLNTHIRNAVCSDTYGVRAQSPRA